MKYVGMMLSILHRRPRMLYGLAWIITFAVAAFSYYNGWHAFDDSPSMQRRDGNDGHTTIDFGGQWLMGRMLLLGYGTQLYNRNYQRMVLLEAYPREDEDPAAPRSDVENLMHWFMGHDDEAATQTTASFFGLWGATDALGVASVLAASRTEWTQANLQAILAPQAGGPLYPPINAFYSSIMALLPPRPAYRVQQLVNIVLAFLTGLAFRLISNGRVWWPLATIAVLAFPGCPGSVNLGQNATLTLAILTWGWLLLSRHWTIAGGMVWGLMAFKPVWAMSFFLVPLLTRRWRTCLAMLATGIVLALATLPFVGWHSWLDWLHVGQEAAQLYNADRNWIELSRDLLNLPRRWWFDFNETTPQERMERWMPVSIIGWCLLGLVVEMTVRLAIWRPRQAQAVEGPAPAFLLLGAWLSCYHFMYYDVLLAALPIFLLFTNPRQYLEPHWLSRSRSPVPSDTTSTVSPGPEWQLVLRRFTAGERPLGLWNRMAPSIVVLLLIEQYLFLLLRWTNDFGPPWDTLCLMTLWLWCGWRWLYPGREVPLDSHAAPALANDDLKSDQNLLGGRTHSVV